MKRYVALLRGVNVGGKSKLPMADLRKLFESQGWTDVATYIQSGNVVFSSPRAVKPSAVEQAISDEFNLQPAVVLRTAEEMRAAVDENPFPKADESHLHIGFMAAAPKQAALRDLDVDRFQPEEVVFAGPNLYLHLPNGMGRAKLPPYLVGRLGTPVTMRNWATARKLAEMAAA